MTPKQEAFVREYLIDLNATQAAIRAGYAKSGAEVRGSELLRNRKVASAIQRGMNIRSEKLEVTADYVLETIVSTIERCKQAEPVIDRKGDPVMVETPDGGEAKAYTFNAAGVLKGAELLGKHLKLFTEKVEHSGPDGAAIQIEAVKADAESFTSAITSIAARSGAPSET
jgi:phage terminase small subunit